MSKKLLKNIGAEKEANDVGMRYMNSADVMSDMRRDYGSALDGVKVHDDSIANAKVTEAGVDGLASGKDIYMRAGSLSSHAPEVNGLLAHEVAHTMQQSGGEMHESAEFGSEQGGLIDWFKSKFGKKETPLQISQPSLVSHSGVGQLSQMDKAFLESYQQKMAALKESEADYIDESSTQAAKDKAKADGVSWWDRRKIRKYKAGGEPGASDANYRFNDLSSLALYQMVKENGDMWGQSDLAKTMITDDFNRNMRQRLQAVKGESIETQRGLFRGSEAGELGTINMLTRKMLPEGYTDSLVDLEADMSGIDESNPVEAAKQKASRNGQAGLDKIAADIDGGELSQIGDMLGSTRAAFIGSDLFDSDEEASAMMMNNLVLRAINGQINTEAAAVREQGINVRKDDRGQIYEEVTDPTKIDRQKKMVKRSAGIMKELKDPFADDAQRTTNPVLQALKGIFGRKKR